MITKLKKTGLTLCQKTAARSYSISCYSLSDVESKAFQTGLQAFLRTFDNITLSQRRQARLPLKGVSCKN